MPEKRGVAPGVRGEALGVSAVGSTELADMARCSAWCAAACSSCACCATLDLLEPCRTIGGGGDIISEALKPPAPAVAATQTAVYGSESDDEPPEL